jgi:hypothetical protein
MTSPRRLSGFSLVYSHSLQKDIWWVTGGETAVSVEESVYKFISSTTEYYDFETETWTAGIVLEYPIHGHCLIRVS